MRQYTQREQWFIDRIGKRIYRNDDGCHCVICNDVIENGLIINDKFHATYIYEIEGSFNADGCPLRYFDTKQEAIDFENSLKP